MWGGKLAESLGLAGNRSTKPIFEQMCDNINPVTGKRLTPRNERPTAASARI